MNHPTKNKSLAEKIVWHFVVFGLAIFIAVFFGFVLGQGLIHRQTMLMIAITFVQLEIFIWLGTYFFHSVKAGSPDFKKKMIFRLVLFYLVVLAIGFLFYVMLYTYFFIKGGADFSLFISGLLSGELNGFFRAVLIGFTLGTVFFFYSQWAEAVKREQKLTQEKLVFQYETLKKQVNPHFLFNSLNTLSSLVGKDAELSEIFIQKLSSVYRYILENMEKELVPVATEIDFVNDYFYLQQIRDQQKIKLIVDVFKMENAKIPPVSLQMLVENALKHNVSTKSNPLKILIQNEGNDELVVSNKLQRKQQMNDSSKIGLRNLNERCKLIMNREIEIIENPEEFIVKVPVKAD